MTFKLTVKQAAAQALLAGVATWLMLFGGGRSGKTFLHIRNIVMRALKAPGSRHLIARQRFKHLKATVVLDTFPKVMRKCFPDLVQGTDWGINKTDWYARLPGGSEIWFCGLDEGDRLEKILGFEFATIYLNECSQMLWSTVQMLLTRLAQGVMQVAINGEPPRPLKLRFLFDCNPPPKSHWTFKVFRQKLDPETKQPLANPDDYASFQMNPVDNQENLSHEYLTAMGGLSARMKKRFVDGEFSDATPNQLFTEVDIDQWRVIDGEVPDMVRVVVSVDPSGAGDDEANTDNDEIGITVDGIGTDGNAYLLEDLTVKAGPATWGMVAVQAYMRHGADAIVGEVNFGGGMVKFVVQAAAQKAQARVNFKMVTASRGKVQRAEPFSVLYENGKVRHVGLFPLLEDEMCAFSTIGYTGPKSPNRADAHIWSLAELFPAMVKAPTKKNDVPPIPMVSHFTKR